MRFRSKRTEQNSALELNPGTMASDTTSTKQVEAFPYSSVPPMDVAAVSLPHRDTRTLPVRMRSCTYT